MKSLFIGKFWGHWGFVGGCRGLLESGLQVIGSGMVSLPLTRSLKVEDGKCGRSVVGVKLLSGVRRALLSALPRERGARRCEPCERAWLVGR